jgi:pimeloyl-ACP methyl ester carboxylesterase
VSSFVLVPGACHGGWWYEPLVTELHRAGHQAQALTLSGLGPGGLAGAGQVNLVSHVAETAAAVVAARHSAGEAVVLVGHSYAGSVITGAADQLPEQVRALVYLDAFVPDNDDSCWSMTNEEQRRWYIESAARTGLAVDPLPFFDLRARPHPLASLLQRSALTGAWQTVPSKTYVAATGWPAGSMSPFIETADRLAADPAWAVHLWDTRHNVLHDGPSRVLDLLLTF